MAEGVDQAADAFRTEIAPEPAPRQRDESGRFASGPERIFGERPTEGDPETGDTSDGGEDQRLRQKEKDEADGWTDRTIPKKREPPSDDGRPPEKFGDKEVEDDGEDKESEEKPADDGPRYEVTVDGERMEVSLPEALKGYVREATFYKRMQRVSEAAQAVQQEAQATQQQRDAYAQRIDYLQRILGSLTPPQPDWEREFQADPRSAHEKLKAHAAIQSQFQWAAQEQQRVEQERAAEMQRQAAEYDRNAAQYAHNEFGRFVQEANIQDEKTLNDTLSQMRNYAKLRGFGEGEIATIYDSRMQLVLRDAAMYHQSTAEQPKPVPAERGRTLVPGSSTPATRRSGEVGRRSIDDAQKQLARSGRLDDAATVFQRILR